MSARIASVLCGALLARVALVWAQAQVEGGAHVPEERSADSTELQEVVVTARRREERLQDVPASVAAFDQADIARLAIGDVEDVLRLTPGLAAVVSVGPYAPIISIRGIAMGYSGSSTTGIYIDDTPIQVRLVGAAGTNVSAYPAVFDLERIEVLRGPQGTLFGAGAEGGAMRFITPQPSFADFGGHARAEFGINDAGAPSYQLGAAVGGPLVPGTLAFRISAYVQEDAGWIDRCQYPCTVVSDKNFNSVRTAALNAALAWAPTDSLTVTPKIFFQNLASGGPPFYWTAPGYSNPSSGDFVVGTFTNRPAQDQFSLPSLKVEWRSGAVDLISNTSYLNRTRDFTEDFSVPLTEILTGNFVGPNSYSPNPNQNPQREFTQEIRLQSTNSTSRLQWVVGAFYQTLDEQAIDNTFSPGLGTVTEALFGETVAQVFGVPLLTGGQVFASKDVTRDTQKAAFGQMDIRLLDNLTATAGIRYAENGFRYTNVQDGPLNGGPSGSTGTSSSSASTPKVGLDYKPSGDLLVYYSFAKGFRPGASNPPVPDACTSSLNALGYASAPLTYDPDYVSSNEVGFKGDALNRRLVWDFSAYDIKWSKTQTSVVLTSCGFPITLNAGEATSDGFDLQVKYAVSDHLTVEASIGYDDAKVSRTIHLPGAAQNVVTEGDRLPTPPWHSFLSVGYEFAPLRNGARFYLQLDDSYTSNFYGLTANPQDGGYDPEAPGGSKAVNLLLARVGVRKGSWDASIFAKNLLNAHPLEDRFQDVPGSQLFSDETLPPRVIGLTVTNKF